MKKSFVLHHDSLIVVDELTTEQKGILFQAIVDYNLGREVKLEGLMKVVFLPFQNQFIRDDEKYKLTVERNRNNGLQGGRPPKKDITEDNPNNPSGFFKNPSEPKKADSDSDSDNESGSKKDSESDSKKNNVKSLFFSEEKRDLLFVSKFIREHKPEFLEPYIECWNFFADKFGRQKIIKLTEERKKRIARRIKENEFVFPDILKRAKEQEFITENSWFTFDWLIKNNENYLKVLEGNYKQKPKQSATISNPMSRYKSYQEE